MAERPRGLSAYKNDWQLIMMPVEKQSLPRESMPIDYAILNGYPWKQIHTNRIIQTNQAELMCLGMYRNI